MVAARSQRGPPSAARMQRRHGARVANLGARMTLHANVARVPLPAGMRIAIDVRIPSDVRYIQRIVEIVTKECRDARLDDRHCSLNVPVALSEALSNAILRGNCEDPDKQVYVHAEVDDQALVVEVADEGKGFDFSSRLKDPTTPENIQREDGRGLFLMLRLMDRVESYFDGRNVIRLTLRRV